MKDLSRHNSVVLRTTQLLAIVVAGLTHLQDAWLLRLVVHAPPIANEVSESRSAAVQ